MKNPEFVTYERPNGHNEFKEFLAQLPVKDREKLVAVVLKTQQYGLQVATSQRWVKSLGDGLFELRSEFSGNIQRAIYFHAEANQYVITHGFTKKTQKTPQAQIQHAKALRTEFRDKEE
ncbi:type II toxin-antitoxin system RelE/ParE family toxin [Lacticaseibacillus paracasei]|uniref:type II toxin-antitoxin system RelE/ParE family toxin n=1 Tax=Lacticaseibacillus paracasei TaxID=1597 RepID=UPI003394D47F